MKTQQHQCYSAESTVSRGRGFASVADAQKFVDDLRDTPWWYAQGFAIRVARIEVGATKPGQTFSHAWYEKDAEAGVVELTTEGLCERTVLHEVAHVLACAVHGSKSHDPWWARLYLTLVSCVMGPDAYLALQREFDKHGVDYAVTTTPGRAIALRRPLYTVAIL